MTSAVLAGGGTAGHTSPLIATAKALASLGVADLVAVGTAKGLETDVIPKAGLELSLITPVPMPRSFNLDLIKLPCRLAKATWQSKKILKERSADVVVGFGGYVSIPVYLAAWLSRVPVVVHEANNVPGIANKIGARFAVFVGTTFDTQMPGNPQLVGMPMDRRITHPRVTAEEARIGFGLEAERPTLLVSGGSQGALAINRAVGQAREMILAEGIQILHVLGPKNFADDKVISHPSGANYVPIAFVDDMARAYAAADLMVGRAGAGTVMETAVSGLPVIFVPLPWGNGEQARNAQDLVAAGGAVLMAENTLTGQSLGERVTELFRDPDRLRQLSETARGFYPANAAEVLAEAVLSVARKKV